jgi:hypothetical protein
MCLFLRSSSPPKSAAYVRSSISDSEHGGGSAAGMRWGQDVFFAIVALDDEPVCVLDVN